jgi:hypothetical protein
VTDVLLPVFPVVVPAPGFPVTFVLFPVLPVTVPAPGFPVTPVMTVALTTAEDADTTGWSAAAIAVAN